MVKKTNGTKSPMNMLQRLLSVAAVLLVAAVLIAPAAAEGAVTNESAIGDVEYATLQEAINAAQSGETVKLLKDISVSETNPSAYTYLVASGKTITLDLNGYNISGTSQASGNYALISIQGNLTINGTGTIELKHTGNDLGWGALSSVIDLPNNDAGGMVPKLILDSDGVTITHNGGTSMSYGIDMRTYGYGCEVIINKGTVESDYVAIRMFGNSGDRVLTVNGGNIIGENRGIWMQGNGVAKLVLNVKGGTITGGKDGVRSNIESGKTNDVDISISGGTVTSKSGSGIAIVSYGGATEANVALNVDGGTITSESGKGLSITTDSASTTQVNVDLDGGTISAPTELSLALESTTNPTITKDAAVTLPAPEGYEWDNDGKLVAKTYKVTSGEIQNGKLTIPAEGTYKKSVSVIVTPDAGYQVETITVKTVGGEAVTVASGSFTMPADDVVVTATLKAIDYTITITTPTDGSISVNPASAPYHINDTISITATPATGYILKNITVANNDDSSYATFSVGTTFAMPAYNVTLTANFVSTSGTSYHNVTVDSSIINGTISTNVSAAQSGETVEVTVTPEIGYLLNVLSYTCETTSSTPVTISGNTFTMPNDNVTVTATFTKNSYAIATETATAGTISIDKAAAGYGDTVTVTATPNAGYTFSHLTIVKTGDSNTNFTVIGTSFTMPNYPVTVSATFVEDPNYVPVTPSKPSSSSSSGSSVWLTETPTPTPTQTPTPSETVPTDTVPTDIPSTQPTEEPSSPGFGILAALAGLGAVAALRRK